MAKSAVDIDINCRFYSLSYSTLKKPPIKASGKMNCFSPAGNLTRIYFLALSIQITVPLPKVLCLTSIPTSIGARILFQSFSGTGCVAEKAGVRSEK